METLAMASFYTPTHVRNARSGGRGHRAFPPGDLLPQAEIVTHVKASITRPVTSKNTSENKAVG